ncbi:ATP-dependent RNA helicase [Mactra antiquata]
MQEFAATISQNQRNLLIGFFTTLVLYYLVMDSILYNTLQSVDLVNEKKIPGEPWSPFHPLSVKLIMTDHTNHYILTPISERFDEITKFSKTFYFITPNMITLTHLALSFVAAKFIFSESLQSRRIGVLIFQLKILLDAFDGTVFRSRAANKQYKSHHSNFGFWMDSTCDTIGAAALSFSVLFWLWWKCPPGVDSPPTSATSLPWSSKDNNPDEAKLNLVTEMPTNRQSVVYSKQFIFFRCLCFGLQMGLSSAIWDQTTMQYEKVFMAKLADNDLAVLQSTYLHSTTTWLIFWCWRVIEGQSLQQIYLCAIFIDKIWAFLRCIQYLGLLAIILLTGFSFYHVTEIKQALHL